ncbi:MarR family winged helix-turn-helix transcriptional regulator [Nocardiopsis alba]|uniref:MarR family transcriptional regulator n=1 Tax=Nocardiopsis alba TaxID=53437 RepID=A0A7K2INU4_9ACTN|nr:MULTISPECIES: MarR family transcriptional regulator [Nocardiopsis]MEC3894036.1 MarR family transcriptional regulator [Nocardiopsis sp. LDBS1602]MYR31651.1 MarR family transcriptional regulator [Nocardiopsis alba]
MNDSVERTAVLETIGGALVATARQHRSIVAHKMADLGIFPGQEFMLLELREQGRMSPSALSAALKIEPPTVTKMVRRLSAKGLVERTKDPTDGRAVRVGLTPLGEDLCAKTEELWTEAEAQMTQGFSERERFEAKDLLQRMFDNLLRG